jgi:hypothetical protein
MQRHKRADLVDRHVDFHRTAPLTVTAYTVTPGAFGVLECLVGGFDHLFRRSVLYAALRHTHTDGDRHFGRAFARSALASLLVTLRTLLRVTQVQTVMLDGLTHLL